MIRALLVVVLAFGGLLARAGDTLDAIVPVDWQGERSDADVQELRKLYGYGFRKFVLLCPRFERHCRRGDVAAYERAARNVAFARQALRDLADVEIGWWLLPTLGHSQDFPGQRLMDCDGTETLASCPLSDEFATALCERIAAFLTIARPSVMFVEDDYTLSNQGGLNAMKGCFCPLHLAEFSRRTGRKLTAGEIAGLFRHPSSENVSLRQAFADLSRDSLVCLAAKIRRTIDRIDPSMRVCLCQSAFTDMDGDSTEAIARAFAGKTRPMVRVFGAGYFMTDASIVPPRLAHTTWSAQHLPSDFELIHETDPYPHTRFFNSTLILHSELSGAVMAGLHGSFFYCTQYHDDPLGDPGYAERFRDESRRLAAVRDLRATMRLCGVRMVYDPAEVYLFREGICPTGNLPTLGNFLGRMGFPFSTDEDSPAALLVGSTASALKDEQVEKLLSGGVLIDSDAAIRLTERGFAGLIGCRATDRPADFHFDHEEIRPPAKCKRRGKRLYGHLYEEMPMSGWTPNRNEIARLDPLPGAETWSAVCDLDGREIAPATLFFRNARGGRIGVLSRSLGTVPSHPSIFSERKQELFANLFAALSEGRLDVCAPMTPSTWLMAAKNDRELLVMAENLAGEPRDDFVLRFSREWVGGAVSRLAADGTRESIGTAAENFRLPPGSLPPVVPEFYVVTKSVAAENTQREDTKQGKDQCR